MAAPLQNTSLRSLDVHESFATGELKLIDLSATLISDQLLHNLPPQIRELSLEGCQATDFSNLSEPLKMLRLLGMEKIL